MKTITIPEAEYLEMKKCQEKYKGLAINSQASVSVDSGSELKKSPFFSVPPGMTCRDGSPFFSVPCRDGNPGKLLDTYLSDFTGDLEEYSLDNITEWDKESGWDDV
ncbi:hypothetical protein QUF72_12635 [Desulfobacterales bacterium HSG2]|nr:hypothetical protein [Desulfobacterales bacterium HSG2]